MVDDSAARTGIQHVALEIEPGQAERATEFWRLAGFEEVRPPAGLSERAIWMEAGPATARTQIHLLFADPAEAASTGRSGRRSSANHVAIIPPDFDTAVAALRQAGVPVEDRRPHWGAARAFAEHPGGHTVELMAAPPPSGLPQR